MISVISISITSNVYPSFVLGTLKILYSGYFGIYRKLLMESCYCAVGRRILYYLTILLTTMIYLITIIFSLFIASLSWPS